MNQNLEIRRATLRDIPAMQTLEIDAARLYGTRAGYDFCTRLPSRSRGEHRRVQKHGAAWLAQCGSEAIGFLLALPVDGRAHVLEAATAYSHQGKGIGRLLFATFHTWAAEAGFSAATLTTYRDIPWNAPIYERMGYRIITIDTQRPELGAIQAEEAASGFARAPRVAMEKPLRLERG
ncbi:MAG: GNAT family N-acetyltransferase [Methylobacterium sp.]|jgi:GNAT superfamily N-acetyltransferase|nr:GNAT family N-acetyltransferase [Methylobacterium sp.]